VHDRRYRPAYFISRRYPFPKHISRRNMRDTQRLLKQLGLGAFSRTRGTKQNEAEPRHSISRGQTLLRRPRIRPARGVNPS
jgi:hypothetical protein